MTLRRSQTVVFKQGLRTFVALVCSLVLVPGEAAWATMAQPQDQSQDAAPAKVPPDQLDSLVAPIALYPDPLLSQVLVASTYPLEIIQLQ
jgi:hypothetical protein